ncbi:hypothetical protein JZ785_15395 [Alicyclobacillus curvatus]|nr:hypothetical protein JZ785_15395 [Alicyclobacillus curvatus]
MESQGAAMESQGADRIPRCRWSPKVPVESEGADGVRRCRWSPKVPMESQGADGLQQGVAGYRRDETGEL